MKNYIEIKDEYDEDFLKDNPLVFNNKEDDFAKFCLTDVWGSLYYEDKLNEKPISYFRHSNKNSYRFGGFTELGDTYLDYQKGGYHHDDIASKDTIIKGYQKISDNPICYGFSSKEPYSDYRFYVDHAEMKESNFFDVKATRLPITIIDHHSIFPPMSQISQPCIFKGLYEGKKIIGLGSYDRYFMPSSNKKDMGEDLGYICASVSGILDDGRYELAIATISFNGQSCGIYVRENERPIVSYDVKLNTTWEILPYVEDGTCIYKDALFEFGGIKLHINGKCGTKGFTKKPRIERGGQSQVFGTWYVGDTFYKHHISNSFMENMMCYDYILKKKGYVVK